MFYEAPTERLTELSERGREMFESLPPEAREPVKATVARLHDRWQVGNAGCGSCPPVCTAAQSLCLSVLKQAGHGEARAFRY